MSYRNIRNSTLSYRVVRSGKVSYRVVRSGTESYRHNGTESYRNIRNSTLLYRIVGVIQCRTEIYGIIQGRIYSVVQSDAVSYRNIWNSTR